VKRDQINNVHIEKYELISSLVKEKHCFNQLHTKTLLRAVANGIIPFHILGNINEE
jgi:hypothetical protein